MRAAISTLPFVLLFGACAHSIDLTPVPAPLPDKPQAEAGGLQLWAGSKMYSNAPVDVEVYVTPIGVDIDNNSDQPVQFRLEDVHLFDNLRRHALPFFLPIINANCVNVSGDSTFYMSAPGGTGRFDAPTVKSCQYPRMDAAALRQQLREHPLEAGDLENKVNGKMSSVFVRERRNGLYGSDVWFDATGTLTVPPGDWQPVVRFVGSPRSLAGRALGDKVIPPHTRVTGYLFFPRISDDANRLLLVWHPSPSAELQIPFAVVRH